MRTIDDALDRALGATDVVELASVTTTDGAGAGAGSANGSRTASALRLEWLLPAPCTTVLTLTVLTIVSRMCGRGRAAKDASSPSSVGIGLIGDALLRPDEVEIMLGKSSLRVPFA